MSDGTEKPPSPVIVQETQVVQETQQEKPTQQRNKNKGKKKNRAGKKEDEPMAAQNMDMQTSGVSSNIDSASWSYTSYLGAHTMAFRPRSFYHLEGERCSIFASLQALDAAALERLSEIQAINDQLRARAFAPNEVTPAKNHRDELQHLMCQGVDEERELMTRLGEIQVEIQCQDRWQRFRGGPIFPSSPYNCDSNYYPNSGAGVGHPNQSSGSWDYNGSNTNTNNPQHFTSGYGCSGPSRSPAYNDHNSNEFTGGLPNNYYGRAQQQQQQQQRRFTPSSSLSPYPRRQMGQGSVYRPQYQQTPPRNFRGSEYYS